MNEPATSRGLIWIEPDQNESDVSNFARKTGLSPAVANLLLRRGVSVEEVADFLNPTLRKYFPDPSSFRDMDTAAQLIAKAILDDRPTAVLADYDVDGATSAAQLIRYFRHFGRDLTLYVPDRLTEGYGPSPDAFANLKARGIDLVITVDCGAAAEEALAHADDIGLDIIVLDHHLMGEDIPKCAALVNPNRPDCNSGQGHLAAAGVVFVLLAAVNRFLRQEEGLAAGELPDLIESLDLCALGTLCDMAPLKGVNRAFVLQGMKVFAANDSAGVSALCQVSGRSRPERITDLTFGLGPQLNAGGRIGDPWLATELLAAVDFEEALPIAEKLFRLNEARKEIESRILQDARQQLLIQLEKEPDLPVAVVSGEGWHPGVIGIVASRLKEEFLIPSVVIGYGDDFGDLAKGSARSVEGINIGNAIARARDEGILKSGGGHAMAGGLSVDTGRIDEFRNYLVSKLQSKDRVIAQAREVKIDFDVLTSALNIQFIDILEQAGPYGAGAPKPILRIKEARVLDRRQIGKNHMKVTLDDGSGKVACVAWRATETPLWDGCRPGSVIDVIGYADRNSWQGRDSVQIEIIDTLMKN